MRKSFFFLPFYRGSDAAPGELRAEKAPKVQDENNSITDEAATWLGRLDAGDLTRTEGSLLQKWIDQSPLHKEEIIRVVNIWRELGVPSLYGARR